MNWQIRNPDHVNTNDCLKALVETENLYTLSDLALRLYLLNLYHADPVDCVDRKCIASNCFGDETAVCAALDELCRANLLSHEQDSNDCAVYRLKSPALSIPQQSSRIDDRELYLTFIRDLFRNQYNEIRSAENRYSAWIEKAGLNVTIAMQILQTAHDIMLDGILFNVLDELVMRISADESLNTNPDLAIDFLKKELSLRTRSANLLVQLGKNRQPTKGEIELYRKWREEWSLTDDAISEAVKLSTAAPNPSMKYIDGILRNKRSSLLNQEPNTESDKDAEDLLEKARELAATLGLHPDFSKANVRKAYISVYRDLSTSCTEDVIRMAAIECGKQQGSLTDTVDLVHTWKNLGLKTVKDIQDYLDEERLVKEILQELASIWNITIKETERNRATVIRWLRDFGMTKDMIMAVADCASHAVKPMAYLNVVLKQYEADHVCTVDQLIEHKRKKNDLYSQQNRACRNDSDQQQVVTENMYKQRENEEPDGDAIPMFLQEYLKKREEA